MMTHQALLIAGLTLLSLAAFTGYAQHAAKGDEELFRRWRVAHSGGTAGGVQLIALAAVWQHAGTGWLSSVAAVGVTASTWAFFLGPLASALGRHSIYRALVLLGALVALPGYLSLVPAFL